MKKIIMIVVCTVLVISLTFTFTACGSKTSGDAANPLPEPVTESADIDELYRQYRETLIELDDSLKEKIDLAMREQEKIPICWPSARCYYVNNDCAILFEPAMLCWVQSEKIAGAEFNYHSSFVLWVYNDGCVMEAKDAFSRGMIDEEALNIAAENHRKVENYISAVILLYNQYKDSIHLDNNLKEKIALAFREQNRSIPWYDVGVAIRCYYVNNDCAILFERTELPVVSSEKIAGAEFNCNSSFVLWVYNDGCVMEAKDAFSRGMIDAEALSIAAGNHRIFEIYISID